MFTAVGNYNILYYIEFSWDRPICFISNFYYDLNIFKKVWFFCLPKWGGDYNLLYNYTWMSNDPNQVMSPTPIIKMKISILTAVIFNLKSLNRHIIIGE